MTGNWPCRTRRGAPRCTSLNTAQEDARKHGVGSAKSEGGEGQSGAEFREMRRAAEAAGLPSPPATPGPFWTRNRLGLEAVVVRQSAFFEAVVPVKRRSVAGGGGQCMDKMSRRSLGFAQAAAAARRRRSGAAAGKQPLSKPLVPPHMNHSRRNCPNRKVKGHYSTSVLVLMIKYNDNYCGTGDGNRCSRALY